MQIQEQIRLDQARTALSVSQRALAERARTNRLTLRRAEAGTPIMIDNAVRILEGLNAFRREHGLEPLRLGDVAWLAREEK